MYERLQIQSLLQTPDVKPQRGTGLFLMTSRPAGLAVYASAVAPAMEKNGISALRARKMPIPGVGWLAYGTDPGGNIFGVMHPDENAK